MLKQEITYEDFNGNTVTESFYFNMTKSELIELEAGGLEAVIRQIVATEDRAGLIEQFKKIILAAYGQKSPDGKRFIKNDELREEFIQTAAYDALFMMLATDDVAAANFISGILPKDMQASVQNEMKTQIQPLAPTSPLAPPTA